MRGKLGLAGGTMAAALLSAPAMAQTVQQTSSLALTQNQPLRFGSFAVLDHGSKSVGALGAVIDEGLVTLGNAREGPAEFTLTWQRGTTELRPVTVVVQLAFARPAPVSVAGVNAQITSYEVDLGGLSTIMPGGGLTYTFADCASSACSVTFHVGARIDVSAGSEGGALTLALPVSARIVAEN